MANATVSRLGDVNSGGSTFTTLFLKQFAGEVLTAFATNTVMLDKHLVRTISSGSLRFASGKQNSVNCWKLPMGQSAAKSARKTERFNDYGKKLSFRCQANGHRSAGHTGMFKMWGRKTPNQAVFLLEKRRTLQEGM